MAPSGNLEGWGRKVVGIVFEPAAGVVIEETDGRFWLVAPTNQAGGYAVTFPKGRPVPGATLQQTARCEV